MMGSGKSTIGRLLAAATGWRYVDNDDLVMRGTGMSSRALLEARGEGPMREAERDAAERALAEAAPVIVGIASGAIVDEEIRRAVAASGFVVWLRASSPSLAARAAGADHRPFLADGGAAWIAATNTERAPFYEAVADLAVDTDRLGAEDAAERIVAAIDELAACPPVGTPDPRDGASEPGGPR